MELQFSRAYLSLGKNLEAMNACADLAIFDNSPEPAALPALTECWRVHYTSAPSNPGLAKAYNQAFCIGRSLHKKWLLFLDQDTFFPEDALTHYAQSVNSSPGCLLFVPILQHNNVALSPCWFWFSRGFRMKSIKPGLMHSRHVTAFNSGMLVGLDAFEKVGGYNEEFPLYFSDFAFLDRFRSHFSSLCVVDCCCDHAYFDRENTDVDESLRRFQLYCKARSTYANTTGGKAVGFAVSFAKATKLFMKFRTSAFYRAMLKGCSFTRRPE